MLQAATAQRDRLKEEADIGFRSRNELRDRAAQLEGENEEFNRQNQQLRSGAGSARLGMPPVSKFGGKGAGSV